MINISKFVTSIFVCETFQDFNLVGFLLVQYFGNLFKGERKNVKPTYIFCLKKKNNNHRIENFILLQISRSRETQDKHLQEKKRY